MGDVTQILSDIAEGDQGAAEKLLPLIYNELRRLAAQRMAGESLDNTLQATALVHEAYVRLVDVDEPHHWNGRGHFFGAAATAMRRILVERARQRNSLKRGGGMRRVQEADCLSLSEEDASEVLAVNEALNALAEQDQRAAELVQLRFFSGLTNDEAARILNISPRQAHYLWAFARSWLHREISWN